MKIRTVAMGVVAFVVAVVASVWIIGTLLPQDHSASVTVQLDAPRTQVWMLVRDLPTSAEWREGVDEIRRLWERDAEVYVESNDFGPLSYMIESEEPPHQLVTRIVDNEDFGGTWTYVLEEGDTPAETVLTITEDGEVYSPVFRFFARFVFGYTGTLDDYASDIRTRTASPANPSP